VPPSPEGFGDAKFAQRENFAHFFRSLVFSVWQVLKKALEFFAGMVRPGTIDRREQKITLSEAASLGQTSVFLKHLLDQKDTVPAREKDAPKPAGLGGV